MDLGKLSKSFGKFLRGFYFYQSLSPIFKKLENFVKTNLPYAVI